MIWGWFRTEIREELLSVLVGCGKAVHEAESPMIGVDSLAPIVEMDDHPIMGAIAAAHWGSVGETTRSALNSFSD